MKIKYSILTIGALVSTLLFSCNKQEPFSVAGPDDEVHILSPTFPDLNKDGSLPIVTTINRDSKFVMDLVVTPSQYTEVKWYIDDEEVATGNKIEKELLAGIYDLKVVATTVKGKTASRHGLVEVKALKEDPYAITKSFERIVAPNIYAQLYGGNLSTIKKLKIGNALVEDVRYVAEEEEEWLGYIVPNISEGVYRVVLIDENDNEYGGGTVTVSAAPLVTSGAYRVTRGGKCTLTGINLGKVNKITIGNEVITDFISVSDFTVEFRCPDIEEGDYEMTGSTSDGTALSFFKDEVITEGTIVTITSAVTLWSGHHYVSWELADGDPNKSFNLIGKDVFAGISAGATITVKYSLEPSAGYHQINLTSGWWHALPGSVQHDIFEDGEYGIELTKAALDLIQAEDGFLVVGHGFYVDLVTLQ